MTTPERIWLDRPDKPGLWWQHLYGHTELIWWWYHDTMDARYPMPGGKYTPVLDGDLPEPPKDETKCKWCGLPLVKGGEILDAGLCDSTKQYQSPYCKLRCLERRHARLREKAKAAVDSYTVIAMTELREELEDE